MIPADEMNKWNEAVRVAAERDRLRDEVVDLRVELKEARKCITDVRALMQDFSYNNSSDLYAALHERLDEYAGT